MKAKQDFVIYTDKNGAPAPYKSGEPKTNLIEYKIKKGEKIPEDLAKLLLMYSIDYLDIKIVKGRPDVTGELANLKRPPIRTKRKYSEESLLQVYNKSGMKGLKEIGAKFDPPITDRSKGRLISEILTAQERIRREGK